MINSILEQEIQRYAINKYPEEICGFIVDSKFIPIKNIHSDPIKHFEVHVKDWNTYAHVCEAFVHSHPDGYPCPSEQDMRQQEATGIIWGILSVTKESCTKINFFGDQLPIPDLLNRTFCHGITDCYSLIRDWYRVERDTEIIQIPRSWEWWEKDQDLYTDNFKKAGFEIVSQDIINKEGPKEGDVFLASVGVKSNKLNHGGLYLGSGLGLHHVTANKPIDPTRLARKEPIQRWLKFIRMWVRYEG